MQKMPTLFKREFQRGLLIGITREVTPGCEWVLSGEGIATEKVDGAACAIIDGEFYKRFDYKMGRRKPNAEMIPCQPEPDPVTGHWPWWVKVRNSWPEDKWFTQAFNNTPWCREDGTYEAVGKHFQTNPYGLDDDFLERHGRIRLVDCPRDFDGLKDFLCAHEIEGVVFHRGNGEMCKIKRTDFGLEWPVMREEDE